MLNACTDIQATLSAYLDGELQDTEVHEFESHLSDCSNCQVSFESQEQEHSALRAHLASPPLPSEFMERKILAALDAEDETRKKAARSQWFSMPVFASAVAAAALFLFVWTNVAEQDAATAPKPSNQVAEDVARQHLQEPIFVSNDRKVGGRSAGQYMNRDVRAPHFPSQKVKFIGWSPSKLGGRQAASFIYELRNETGLHRVHAHAVAIEELNFRSQKKLIVDGLQFWVDGAYGFNTVTYHPVDSPVAYVFSSDISLDALVAMVTRTDIVNVLRP